MFTLDGAMELVETGSVKEKRTFELRIDMRWILPNFYKDGKMMSLSDPFDDVWRRVRVRIAHFAW